jgi:PhnB protein
MWLSISGGAKRLHGETQIKPDRNTNMNTKTNDRNVQSYLFFDGRCDEALEFYRQTLGAEVEMLMRFKDSPEPAGCPGASPDKVMHASFRIGETRLMASDGRCEGKASFQGFALSLSVPNEAEADRRFAALAKGGKVQMPLTSTFFSPRFGMVADRFGVMWMVIVPAEQNVAANRAEAMVR